MKIIAVASLLTAILLISSIHCQTPGQVEDQISPADVLETSNAGSVVTESDGKLVQGDEDEEDEEEPSTSSMIPNTNNTIAKIVEAVASNMTANIMPNVKEVKIPMDIGAVLETVSQQMFKPEGDADTPDGSSRWVQNVARKAKRLYAFSNESSGLEDLNRPYWYDQSLSSNQSDWIWISSAFYDLMNNFVIQDTNNEECKKHSEIYLQHLKNFTYWAMKMRDSSVLSPTGLLDGNFWQLGNYDECVGMYITKPDFRIIGKYCLPQLTFRPTRQYYPDYYREHTDSDYYGQDADANAYDFFRPNKDPAKVPRNELHWAICIPHTCTTTDLQTTLQKSFNELSKKYPLEFEVKVEESKCFDDTEREYTTGFFVFVAFFLLICTLVAVCTTYDILVLRTEYWTVNETLKQWTLPFSVVENVRKLCQHSKSPDDLQFSTVHMLKCISIAQVVMGHRVMNFLGNVLVNPQFTESRVKNPFWGYFNNGPVIVDTFFVIGGFLTFYYLFLELEDRKGKINFLVIYIYRILRITPVYMIVVAFYIHVLPYLGEGPLWETLVVRESDRCRENWWTNLLYINNYVNTDNQCMLQAWYLACDFHFFIAGTIVCWIVWKWRKSGYPLMVFLMVLSIVYPPYVVYQGQYWSHFKAYISNMADPTSERFFQDIYVKSHLRAFPYIFGMFCGLLYIDLKKSGWMMPFWYKWGTAGLFCIIGHIPFIGSGLFYVPGRPYDAMENAIFFSLQRLIWAPIIGFIIVGHGTCGFEMASKFANLRMFVPVGRLTFCCYLVHVIFQMMDIGSMRSPNFMSYTNITFGIFQDLGLTAIGGLVLNLLIESPLDRFQKMFVKKLLKGQKLPSMLAKKEQVSESQGNMLTPEPGHLTGNLNMAFEQSNSDKPKTNV
uniref:Nose resistant to fluoxetine protein 6 n=1 Tax=Cacopsylla melanoneura TaxID=428564 RepID=A0A8D8Z1N9_9HEMI